MHISYESGLEHIKVNTMAVARILQSNGMPSTAIDTLCIHIQTQASEQQQKIHEQHDAIPGKILGLHTKNVIYLFTHHHPVSSVLNYILLHELHHEIKNGYQPGEWDMPYTQRPSEKAANQFAKEQAVRSRLITIPGQVDPLSLEEVTDKLLHVLALELVVVGCLVLNKLARSV
jgi:hypothetical protein